MRGKLFRRDFTLVVIGQIISLLGNAVLRFVLPLYLLDVTGSRSLFGLCSAAAFVPMVVLTPLGGVVAESQPEVLGPAPAPVLKVNNRYRYRVLLVGRNDRPTREAVSWLLKTFAGDRANRGTNLFVDCNAWE